MSVNYVWGVSQLDAYPQHDGETDVVFTVHFNLTGTDGDYTGYVYGTVGVTYNPEEPFVPYNELTLEQVIGWVQDALGAEQVAAYEANVAQQIADQQNPPVVSLPLPWASSEE